MNKEDEDRQIRETRSLLQKASQRNASLDTRREALRRLISLTHTPSRELKVFAAQNFSHYFKDFPELEEDVIDSVYDICEDPDPQVRIEGYRAIVALSTEAKKWTRRNTDVLVQLLQSDEPVELGEIKKSLKAHIKLDAAAAIGVMCDHCCLDPDMEADEKKDRERLRKIVLFFFANDAKKDLFAHFNGPASEPEQVFREGLLKAIGQAEVEDTEIIVKELLLHLMSYSSRSEHGDELLRVLLDKVKLIYTELKARPGPISLAPLQPYLSLLEYVAVVRHLANPGPLLRFYGTTLIGKMALQKLDPESQLVVIQRVADTLATTEEERMKQSKNDAFDELSSLRNTVVDACPHIFDRIVNAPIAEIQPWKACLALLRACRQRHEDQRWRPSTNLTHSLRELNVRTEQAPSGLQDVTQQIHRLIQDLDIGEWTKPLQPNNPKFSKESSLTAASGNDAPLDDRPDGPRKGFRSPTPSRPSQVSYEPSPRGPKLINRIGGDVSVGIRSSPKEPPTLLRRISVQEDHPANGATAVGSRLPAESSSDGRGASVPTAPEAPLAMLSIKGAASKLLAEEIEPQHAVALIDRMQIDERSHDPQAGRKKRKRKAGGG